MLLRPHQWLKNLLLLFPPFFGGKILDPEFLITSIPAIVSFSFAASSGYILNDILDRAFDKHHETKKDRAIARGDIPVAIASAFAAVLGITALLVASAVSRRFEGFLIIYFFTSFIYTIYFKHFVILDIFFISFGFLIRVLAGGEAFRVIVSDWLFLTVFIVALFLAAGKRLGELISLAGDAGSHRRSLTGYSQSFLEGVLWFAASATLVTYALYTLEHKRGLFYTVPLAAFGLLRYIYIVNQGKGDPTEALLKDGQVLGVGIVWALMIGLITYR